ncbi:hypothetical protein [Marinimicrobium sp. ABcell2]|uniref:hypothetical protein n=1 Tax=Marinimicrobium sp. ABcell2 TaxID=3069751 RepID=UPI0027B33690|nr:hypothetical protein [Marinimicrobium sp. ABcell2]MDQ2077891.1 hypothetical protein [Marinimicrobium sp. ABcell2]
MTEIAVLNGGLDHFEANAAARHQRLEWLLGELGNRYGAQARISDDDAFQVALSQPRATLECALFIRAGLLAVSPSRKERWDARISMALGESEPGRGTEDAYRVASHGLEALERGHLTFYANPEPLRLAVSLATAFADDILSHWTPSEAEAYFEHLLKPDGHKAIAQRLNKSRPTVTKTLLRARYNLLDRYRRDAQALMALSRV